MPWPLYVWRGRCADNPAQPVLADEILHKDAEDFLSALFWRRQAKGMDFFLAGPGKP
jgi:hypothetical protein